MSDMKPINGGLALADPMDASGAFDDDWDEFTLDVRVVVAAHPNGKLQCSTGDGCGSTCQGSACNSFVEDPA